MLNRIKSALEKLLKKTNAPTKDRDGKSTSGPSAPSGAAKKGKETDKKKEGKDIYPMW
jgi:hypothetical protein